MPEQNQKPTKEDRMLRALEFLASDLQGVRIEVNWIVGPDRRTCKNMADVGSVVEALKAQIAVQLPRATERLVGMPMPKPRPGFMVTVVGLRIMAPADAFLKARSDSAPVNAVRFDMSDKDVPMHDEELRFIVGRGTFGCRIVT